MPSKQEILAEIRRTADANSGTPLGLARFVRETGINEYDLGKHWARFGDAVREAGFAANQWQTAHPNEFLIRKLIDLTRKLGRFPTFREIELERSSDPEMPTKKAFQRLGGKETLAQLVAGYCNANEGLDDVAALCPVTAKKANEVPGTDTDSSLGEVYLAKSGRFYKIGRSNDTVRRGNEIRVQLPERMTLIHSIKTDDPPGVEAYWHRRFESKRMNGEWFDLTPTEVRAFKRWRRIA
jgi:Meiotically up-regulated gene 113